MQPPPPPAQRPMGIPLCASTAINLWVMGVVSLGLSAGGPDTPTPRYRSDPEIDSSQTQVHQAHGRQLEQLGPNRTSGGVRARATPSSCNFFSLLACVWKKKIIALRNFLMSPCVIFFCCCVPVVYPSCNFLGVHHTTAKKNLHNVTAKKNTQRKDCFCTRGDHMKKLHPLTVKSKETPPPILTRLHVVIQQSPPAAAQPALVTGNQPHSQPPPLGGAHYHNLIGVWY